jgi:hypothetical protein
MAINEPATQIWIAYVVTPAGAENLYLSNEEAGSTTKIQTLAPEQSSGNVIFRSTADPIRLVQEELSVSERRFGVLTNSHDDCLDVVHGRLP